MPHQGVNAARSVKPADNGVDGAARGTAARQKPHHNIQHLWEGAHLLEVNSHAVERIVAMMRDGNTRDDGRLTDNFLHMLLVWLLLGSSCCCTISCRMIGR